jgi:signal peptidase I
MRSFLFFLRDVLVIFGIAILVSFLVKTFLVRSFFIPSASMEQTLMIDDRVIVNELVPKAVALNHGDIVVFTDPGGWLPARPPVEVSGLQAGTEWVLSLFGLASPDSNDHLIKRVIGLPGDTVQCCSADGKIIVNGVPISEPYITIPDGETRASAIDFNVTVPENSLFVMGDNRYNSKDSRYNTDKPGGGFVGMDNVVGRAFVLSWPMSHWGVLSNYPEVFSDVPAATLTK